MGIRRRHTLEYPWDMQQTWIGLNCFESTGRIYCRLGVITARSPGNPHGSPDLDPIQSDLAVGSNSGPEECEVGRRTRIDGECATGAED